MAKLTLAEVTTPLTTEQVQANVYAILAALGVNTTVWVPGSVVRTMIVSLCTVYSAMTELTAQIARSGFLALSDGDWLTLVARHVYGVDRRSASYAQGLVLVDNTGGGLYVLDVGDLQVASPTTGHTYSSTEAVTINPGAMGVSVAVIADVAGAASSANADTVTRVASDLPGLACNNPTALTATDEESDASLRVRCAEMLGALSPMGPWDAYTSALRNATRDDGSNLGITRVRLLPDGFGHVYVYCATATGGLSGPDIAVADEAVQRFAAPQAITAFVSTAVEFPIDTTYEVWLYNTSGKTEAQIKATIADAWRVYVNSLAVGGNIIPPDPVGHLYASEVIAVMSRAMPEIFRLELSEPSTSAVDFAINDVATFTAPLVIAVHQVPPPEGYRPPTS